MFMALFYGPYPALLCKLVEIGSSLWAVAFADTSLAYCTWLVLGKKYRKPKQMVISIAMEIIIIYKLHHLTF
jgi:hypothetical protein